MLGYALFFPMCILSFSIYTLWPSFDMCMFFCLFPLSGTFFGAVLGLPVDLFGKNEEEETGEEKEIFTYIFRGKKRRIAIKEKTVNRCIIAGIVLWILLAVLFSVLFADLPKR
jgi:hypothetical protein